MNRKEKKYIITQYNERLKKYGYNPQTLGWFEGRQPLRFTILSEIGDFNNCSVLDVGCGFGDLYGFLTKKFHDVQYTGIDINPRLIAIARTIYPGIHVMVKDFHEAVLDTQFDWVVSSGVFNDYASENIPFVQEMVKKMFVMCTKGVAVDFMSNYAGLKGKNTCYTVPEELFAFCKTLSKRIVLRHDYMPFEFCVYIYKNDRINRQNVFTDVKRQYAFG